MTSRPFSSVAADANVLMSAALLNGQGQLDLAAETYDTVPTDAPEFYLAEIGRAETLRASDRADAASL